MRVELAVQNLENPPGKWDLFADTARWFSVSVLIIFAAAILFLSALVVFLFILDL